MWWQQLAARDTVKEQATSAQARQRQSQLHSSSSGRADTPHESVEAVREAASETEMFRWRCEACDVECAGFDDLKLHHDNHAPCLAPNCSFEASRELVVRHFVQVHMPTASAVDAGESRPSEPVATSTAAAEPERVAPKLVACPLWRCDICDTNFAIESQLVAHIRQHVVCPELGCGYSAVKRLVTQHRSAHHGFVPPYYVCHACGGTDHLIRQCPKKLSRAELAARQQRLGELMRLTRPSSPSSDVTGIAVLLSSLMLAGPSSARLKSVPRPVWRCDACDKNFVLGSQLSAHIGQHEVCPELGCGYSASKRLVTQHRSARHGFVAPHYVCHACGGTGHLIYQCPNKLSRAELVARRQRSA